MQNLRRPGDGMFTIVCGISDETPSLQQYNPLVIDGELCMPGGVSNEDPEVDKTKFDPTGEYAIECAASQCKHVRERRVLNM